MIKEIEVSVGLYFSPASQEDVLRYPFDSSQKTVQITFDQEKEIFGICSFAGFYQNFRSFGELVEVLNSEKMRKLDPHEVKLMLNSIVIK